VEDRGQVGDLCPRVVEQFEESAHTAGSSDSIWDQADPAQHAVWQPIAEVHHRIREIVERDQQHAPRTQDADETDEAPAQLVGGGKVVEG
jgi:hypothetical protein